MRSIEVVLPLHIHLGEETAQWWRAIQKAGVQIRVMKSARCKYEFLTPNLAPNFDNKQKKFLFT